MSSEQNPPRLTETRDAELAELLPGLARARSEGPDPEQLARICAGVASRAAQLPQEPGADETTPAGETAPASETASADAAIPGTSGAAAKLLALLVAGGLLGGGLLYRALHVEPAVDTGARPHAVPAMTAAGPATEPPVQVREPAPAVESAVPPAAVSAAPQAAPEAPAPRRPRAAAAAARQPDSAAELALLKRARAEVRSNAARALALSDEHAARFANGLLAEEREVIAIEALLVLGRGMDAGARARAFFAAYPGSAHARRVRGLLAEYGRALPDENPGARPHPSH